MSVVFSPETADETVEAIQTALAEETVLSVEGAGTKTALGRPVEAAAVLSLAHMNRVRLYEPEELVLTVEPGLPLEDIEMMLAENNQMLAFEPPNYAQMFGAVSGGTIGGAIACGLSGPRRFKAGAARDFVLGVEGVSGRGELFKSGGRVVKNVTGYDLSKLMTGSFGTLAVLTEITLKVLPKPAFETTLKISCASIEAAAQVLQDAARSPFEPSGLAYFPSEFGAAPDAAIRLEGSRAAVDYRVEAICDLLDLHEETRMPMEQSQSFWRDVRDVALIGDEKPLWKAIISPADAPAFIKRNDPEHYYLDWGGGLVWLTMKDAAAIPTFDSGVIYLVRAPAEFRANTDVFPPLSPALRILTERVKKSFDPVGVLNPGRMYLGF